MLSSQVRADKEVVLEGGDVTAAAASASCVVALRHERRSHFESRWRQTMRAACAPCPFWHDARNQLWRFAGRNGTDNGAFYVENQKVASRTLLDWLPAALGHVPPEQASGRELGRNPIWARYRGYPTFYKKLSSSTLMEPEMDALAAEGRAFFLSFVRDPIAGFLSGFQEVTERWRAADHGRSNTSLVAMQHRFGRNASLWPTSYAVPCASVQHRVDTFVDDILHARALGGAAYHEWPQAMKLDVLPDGRSFDFLWKLERFEEGMGRLLERLGRTATSQPELRTKHQSQATLASRACGARATGRAAQAPTATDHGRPQGGRRAAPSSPEARVTTCVP